MYCNWNKSLLLWILKFRWPKLWKLEFVEVLRTKWSRSHFFRFPTSSVLVLFTHALFNGNEDVVSEYLGRGVPITLFHFRMLARLGDEASPLLLKPLKNGVPFYRLGDGSSHDQEDDRRVEASRASLNASEKEEFGEATTSTNGENRGQFRSPVLKQLLEKELESSSYPSGNGKAAGPAGTKNRLVSQPASKDSVILFSLSHKHLRSYYRFFDPCSSSKIRTIPISNDGRSLERFV